VTEPDQNPPVPPAPRPGAHDDRRTIDSEPRDLDADSSSTSRFLAIGAIVGPVAFVAAWAIGAFVDDRDLSVVDDAISQLAHVDANTRWLMTAGFVAFGLGVGTAAIGMRHVLGRAAAIALAVAAVSTLAVAALPLGVSDLVDRLHGIAAGIGYVALAAAPFASVRPLRRLGARRFAGASVIVAAVAAISLAATVVANATGAFQRIGLTVVDVWIVTAAALVATGRITEPDRAGRPPHRFALPPIGQTGRRANIGKQPSPPLGRQPLPTRSELRRFGDELLTVLERRRRCRTLPAG
jgi:hypothetical membrane protein